MSITPIKINESRPKRLQFDFSDSEVRELDHLMVQCGLSTRKDLFSNALTLLRWVSRETLKGNEIASVEESTDQYFVLNMPIFDSLRRYAEEFEISSDPVVKLTKANDRKRRGRV